MFDFNLNLKVFQLFFLKKSGVLNVCVNLLFICGVGYIWASQVALVVKNESVNAGDRRDVGSIPESGRSPGEGPGNTRQYSCLENPCTGEPGRLQSIEVQRI